MKNEDKYIDAAAIVDSVFMSIAEELDLSAGEVLATFMARITRISQELELTETLSRLIDDTQLILNEEIKDKVIH
jgi:hypothetical protein